MHARKGLSAVNHVAALMCAHSKWLKCFPGMLKPFKRALEHKRFGTPGERRPTLHGEDKERGHRSEMRRGF